MGIKLYSYWRSSSAWRVRIALELKGLPFETIPVNLVRRGGEQYGPSFAEMNPLSQVPVLEIEESSTRVTLTQSVAIIEYLEERFGEPSLLPGDALQRARAREFAEIINSGVQPLQNLSVQQELKRFAPAKDPRAFARHFIERGLRALELLVLPIARDFALGEAPTLADVYLIPQLYQARRFGVELSPYPTLLRIERTCQALPAFQRAHADSQPDAERDTTVPP